MRLEMRLETTRFAWGAILCAALFAAPVFAQSAAARDKLADPAALVGTTLADLFAGAGAPKSVYPVRGPGAWQDDVVFVYDAAECYLSGNRVWQVKVPAFGGFKQGDPKAQVARAMGEGKDFEGYSVFPLPSRVWPLMLRVNWDASGRAKEIFVYRSDF